jgi:integrase
MSLLEKYQARLVGEGKASGTLLKYTRIARLVFERFEEPKAITKDEMLDFRDELAIGKKANSIVTDTACLNHLTEYLGLGFRLKAPRREYKATKPLEREEIGRMIAAAGENPNIEMARRDTAMLLFMAESAFRRDQVRRTKLEDLDFERGRVRIRSPKGKSEDWITLTDIVMRAIAEYLQVRGEADTEEDEEHLFLSVTTHRKLGERAVMDVVKRSAAKAGISRRVYCHLIRHSKLTQLGEDGISPYVIRRHANHKSLEMTMRYVNLSDQTVRSQIRSAPMVRIESVRKESIGPDDALKMLAVRLALGEIDQNAFDRAASALGGPNLENLL